MKKYRNSYYGSSLIGFIKAPIKIDAGKKTKQGLPVYTLIDARFKC